MEEKKDNKKPSNRIKNIIIIIFIILIAFIIINGSGVTSNSKNTNSHDNYCDICGAKAYNYDLGDGYEYCKKHFEEAANWYLRDR